MKKSHEIMLKNAVLFITEDVHREFKKPLNVCYTPIVDDHYQLLKSIKKVETMDGKFEVEMKITVEIKEIKE